MKKILHILGIHDWTNWGEPISATETDYGYAWKLFEKPIVHQVWMQKRMCDICKKVETREVE